MGAGCPCRRSSAAMSAGRCASRLPWLRHPPPPPRSFVFAGPAGSCARMLLSRRCMRWVPCWGREVGGPTPPSCRARLAASCGAGGTPMHRCVCLLPRSLLQGAAGHRPAAGPAVGVQDHAAASWGQAGRGPDGRPRRHHEGERSAASRQAHASHHHCWAARASFAFGNQSLRPSVWFGRPAIGLSCACCRRLMSCWTWTIPTWWG